MASSKQFGCGFLGIFIGFIFIMLFVASAYLLNFALKPEKNKGRDNYDGQYAKMEKRYPWIKPWVDSLQKAKAIKDIQTPLNPPCRGKGQLHAIVISSPYSLNSLNSPYSLSPALPDRGGGKPLPALPDRGGRSIPPRTLSNHDKNGITSPSPIGEGWGEASTAVIVPGYTDCAIDMLHIGYIYNKVLGMNILIPDLYANGKSSGDVMQMGWNDRLDVIRWIEIADSLFKGSNEHARIIVHGQSMGAATVMNVAGEMESKEAPPSPPRGDVDYIKSQSVLRNAVRCYVEDCGYTSAWDEFSYELNDMFGLPDFPLLYSASALCKLKYGWTFGEASPLKQVAKCRKPMLFIHGGNDKFVPTRMVYPLYNAKPAPKYLVVFHGSRHARSYCDHRWEYERRIKQFVERYMR